MKPSTPSLNSRLDKPPQGRPPSLPRWLKVPLPGGEGYRAVHKLVKSLGVATVCQEARCPNIGECWEGGTATFMLMGDVCTRGCRFCAVKTGNPRGKIDEQEPEKLGRSISQLGLDYIVLTSVDRDDLSDLGSGHFARTVSTIKLFSPKILIEALTPDFSGMNEHIKKVVESGLDVFAHNVETVESLQSRVRDFRAGYELSLDVLRQAKKINPKVYTKTSLMVGLGERDSEITQTLKDLREVGCDVVTFGQYLQPAGKSLKVEEFIPPQKFEQLKQEAEEMGFLYVASGPLVRSSYRAGEYFLKGVIEKQKQQNEGAR